MVSEWKVKQEICEMGRRLYDRQFAAGNDGNISYRLSDNRVICTPTQICKGFMKPDDLCAVDMDGKQLSGKRKRTSEVLLHLEIYRGDASVKAVVHCHPPHATAFGVARVDIPSCILPEVEVFLGVIPRAEYETPGGPDFAQTVRPFVGKANTVVLSNHGTVSWGASVERAYWHTEILDAYCRMLILANQIGSVERLSKTQVNELLDLKEQFGVGSDPRRQGVGELCVNSQFGRDAGQTPACDRSSSDAAAANSAPSDGNAGKTDDYGDLAKAVTARVVEALNKEQQ